MDKRRTLVIASNMLNEVDMLKGWFESFVPLANAGIVIVDGGSTDGTIEYCQKQKNTVVVVDDIIQREGYGASRNHLREMSRKYFPDAHWMAFFDADERIHPKDYHRLRFVRDYLRLEFDVVAFPRIDWMDEGMTTMAKDWHVYPDYQARMTRLGAPIEYYRKIHEQVRGFTRIFASPQNPKIHHFHRSAGQQKRDYVGKVCAKLHAEDAEYGQQVPDHHKEAYYREMFAKEGL